MEFTEPLVIAAFGAVILAVAWVPLFTRNVPLSLPTVAVSLGFGFAWWIGPRDLVSRYDHAAELFTEAVLVVAVMGAGLKIDRLFGWANWDSAWRLLAGVLPLTILGLAACGHFLLGLPVGEALLLGGILAPTDPVLAGSVEVGPPGVGEEGETRFALTTEAGLNDGLAFPAVLLGMALMTGENGAADLGTWFLVDFLWGVGTAVGIGIAFGAGLISINHRLPERFRLSASRSGVVSIGVTLIAYGLAEMAHAYGFIAVFVAAVAIRNTAGRLEYTRQIHDFAEEIQGVAMVGLLMLFGAAIAGGLLSNLRIADAAYLVAVLFIVRPLASLLSFIGSKESLAMRVAAGFLGVRGIASLYYIAYVSNHAELADEPHMQALVSAAVLASILVFGFAADPVMRYLDRQDRSEEA